MKRLGLILAIAGAMAIMYAATAPAGEQAVTPRQFATLSKRVATLEKTMNAAVGLLANCLTVQAISVARYGTSSEGYVYKRPDGTLIITTGLDLVPSGQTPQAYLVGTTATCASAFHPLLNANRAATTTGSMRAAAPHQLSVPASKVSRARLRQLLEALGSR
jgi:hypothetical protein